MVTASAPGKILLCGEYAVLANAPAICVAIDRRARVTVSCADAETHSVRSTSKKSGVRHFRSSCHGKIEWLEHESTGQAPHLLDYVWQQFEIPDKPSIDMTLDTDDFFDTAGGQKLGLGSSAALTVAITTALAELSGEKEDAADKCFAAHQEFQGGTGSGVDVATSLGGGIIQYRMQDASSRRMPWPPSLEFAVFWSGKPSNTVEKLKVLQDKQKTSPGSSATELSSAASKVARLWTRGSVAELLSGISNYVSVLKSFSLDHELGIFDAGHDELVDVAKNENVVYKPSGAGGGDVGVAFAASRVELDLFSELALRAGFSRLDVSIDDHGASRDLGDLR